MHTAAMETVLQSFWSKLPFYQWECAADSPIIWNHSIFSYTGSYFFLKRLTLQIDPLWMWQLPHTAVFAPIGLSSDCCGKSPYRTVAGSGNPKSRWPGQERTQVIEDHPGAQRRTPSLGKPWIRWGSHFDLYVSATNSGSWPWLSVLKREVLRDNNTISYFFHMKCCGYFSLGTMITDTQINFL